MILELAFLSIGFILKEERREAVAKKMRDASVAVLLDAGCCEATINDFIQYGRQNNKDGQLRVLNRYRKTLLDGLHDFQKKIDVLDYVVYRMKKEER